MGFIRIKVLAEDNTIIAYKPILPLTPGTGFVGPESPMAAIGTPGDLGYDCKAIARWDVVPFQVATDGFNVGVVAYHREGIEKVSFSLNGGLWVDVLEMSLNPTTDEFEYCASLSLSTIPDDEIEVRARVIPTVGEPRILAGPLDDISLGIGEHSMFLAAVNTPRPEYFVSPTGSDTTGTGTRSLPYATIPHAILAGAGNGTEGAEASGAIVTLLPGDHHYDLPNSVTLTTAWLTLRSDYSEPSAITRFTSYTNNAKLDKIHVQNMQFDQPAETNWASYMGTKRQWLDTCDIQGNFVYTVIGAGYVWKWATNCTAVDIKDTPFGNQITRNCHIDGLLQDAFGGEELLLSSSVKRHSREQTTDGNSNSPNPAHPDVWSKFIINDTGSIQYIENIIIRDVTASDRIEAQGLFFKGVSAAYRDIAVVNANINNSWAYDDSNSTWAGPGYNNFQACLPFYIAGAEIYGNPDYKHFLMSNCSMWTSWIGDEAGGYGGISFEDAVFKNNIVLSSERYMVDANDLVTNILMPVPDGKDATYPAAWPGTLPWTSSGSGILYTN